MANVVSITYCGVTKNITEWAEFFGVTKAAIGVRMKEHDETYQQAIAYFATRSGSADGRKSTRTLLAEILAELKIINHTISKINV